MTTFDRALLSRVNVFKNSSILLPKWRAARARVRTGTGRGRLLCIGTSITQGYAALGTATAAACWPVSYPSRLASELSARGIATSTANFFGDTNAVGGATTYPLYDTRLTKGANWGTDSTHPIIGGFWFPYTTGAANNLTFTPTVQVDTAIPIQWKGSVGTFTFNVDGGSSLGTSTGGSTGWESVAGGTFAKGAHIINIVPNNNGSIFLGGIIAYDSTTPAIDVIQGGYNGATVAAYIGTGQGYNSLATFAALAPDLTIIGLDANDIQVTAVATWTASMQTLITAALAVGDVVLMKEPPGATDTAQQILTYQNAYQQLAITNGIPLIDVCTRWVSYTAANGNMPYGSGRHPAQVGLADMAIAVADLLTA